MTSTPGRDHKQHLRLKQDPALKAHNLMFRDTTRDRKPASMMAAAAADRASEPARRVSAQSRCDRYAHRSLHRSRKRHDRVPGRGALMTPMLIPETG